MVTYSHALQTADPKWNTQPCNCVGPQNGDPVCPCMMRSLKVLNGRRVRIVDYGPVPVDQDDL